MFRIQFEYSIHSLVSRQMFGVSVDKPNFIIVQLNK